MIYLWHSNKGVPFHQEKESQTDLGEKLRLASMHERPQLLRRGERRLLTSGFSNGCFFQHSVQVSRNRHRARFKVLSSRFAAAFLGGQLVFLPEDGVNNFMEVIIPDQRPFMMVALPDKEPGLVRIVDLVYYRPPIRQTQQRLSFSLN